MQALQTELRQRGLLDADWQPSPAVQDAAAEHSAAADTVVEHSAAPHAAELPSNGTPHDGGEPQFATTTDHIAEERVQ